MNRLKRITAFLCIVLGVFSGMVAMSLLSDMIKESFSKPSSILAFVFVCLIAFGLGWSGYWIMRGELHFKDVWLFDSEEINKIKSSRSFITLAVFIVVTSVLEFLYACFAINPSSYYQRIYQVGIGWLIAWWVIEDQRTTNFRPCYEYSAFVFIFWLVLLPHYLFRTRGGRGLFQFGTFLTVLMLPRLIASGVRH